MGSFILLVIFIVGPFWWYATKYEYQSMPKEEFWTIRRFRTILVVLFAGVGTFYWANRTFDEIDISTPEKAMEYGRLANSEGHINYALKEIRHRDEHLPSAHFNYLTKAGPAIPLRDRRIIEKPYYDNISERIPGNNGICISLLGKALLADLAGKPAVFKSLLENFPDSNYTYRNYLLGEYHREQGDNQNAVNSYYKEITAGGDSALAVKKLASYYYQMREFQALDELLGMEWAAAHFPRWMKTERYFLTFQPLKYYAAVLERPVKAINWAGAIAGLLVTLVWMLFIYRMDMFAHTPMYYLWIAFGLGFVFAELTAPLSDFLNHYLNFRRNGSAGNDLMYYIIGVGMIEELVKAMGFLLFLRFTKIVEEPMDVLMLAMASALGFAFNENLLYYEENKLDIIASRAMISVLIHITCTGMVAYGYILARFKGQGKLWLNMVIGFAIAAVVHGVYDWILGYSFVLALLVYGLNTHWLALMINNALNNSEFFDYTKIRDNKDIRFFLICGFLAIVMTEYLIVSYKVGTRYANYNYTAELAGSAYLIFYVAQRLSVLDPFKNYWRKIDLSTHKELLIPPLFSPVNFVGLEIGLFKRESTQYALARSLPAFGKLVDRKIYKGNSGHYLIQLQQEIGIKGAVKDHLVIGPARGGGVLSNGRQIVGLYLIKEGVDINHIEFAKADLLYGGLVVTEPDETKWRFGMHNKTEASPSWKATQGPKQLEG